MGKSTHREFLGNTGWAKHLSGTQEETGSGVSYTSGRKQRIKLESEDESLILGGGG